MIEEQKRGFDEIVEALSRGNPAGAVEAFWRMAETCGDDECVAVMKKVGPLCAS